MSFETNDYCLIEPEVAYTSTTHLAIVAHQDDAEIIGYSAIHECFQRTDQWFGTITLTNGGSASRGGRYEQVSDSELSEIRQREQIKAAQLGEYSFCQQWLATSQQIKLDQDAASSQLSNTLLKVLPEVIYTHNPFDKHASHRAVLSIVISALQEINKIHPDYKPKVLGIEVWGGLDWLPDQYRVELDCSPMPNLEQALIGLYDSQIDGNKGYDRAVLGRRASNATFNSSHYNDTLRSVNIGIDLSHLTASERCLTAFSEQVLKAFIEEKLSNLTA